ncbi:MAG: membrane protein insertion efficiency factor YidD [Patescibacteria group bacterium]
MKLRLYLIKLIDLYQKYISAVFGGRCQFYPTCSEYTKQSLKKYGVLKGSSLGFLRILRCHPWQKNHFDPVP